MNDAKRWERVEGFQDAAQAVGSMVRQGAAQNELLQIAWRHRTMVGVVLAVSLAAAFVYIRNTGLTYTSTARLYVQPEGPRIVTQFQGVLADQSTNYLYTQCEVLKSTPIISGALDKPGIRKLRSLEGVASPITYLKNSVEATVGAKDDIIAVSASLPYSEDALKVVTAVVDSYLDYNTGLRQSTAKEVLRILQTEKDKRDKELAEKYTAMLEFKKQNGVISFANDGNNIVAQRLVGLSGALTAAQLETVEATAAFATAEAMIQNQQMVAQEVPASPIFGGIENEQLRAELQRSQTRLADLKLNYSDEHPLVIQTRKEIDTLKKEYMALVNQRLAKARKKSADIQALLHEQQEQAKHFNALSATYASLESDVGRTERLCEILDSRIKEINITEDAGALNVTVLEPARPENTLPNSVKGAQVLGVALVLGAVLSVGMAWAYEKLDQRLKTAEEVSEVTGSPVLGVVPAMAGRQTPAVRGQVIHLEPSSNVAEAYRTIRTAVYFGTPKGQDKRLLITSSIYGEGKTTLASNLAIAMAQSGQRTLLIDADFRKPSQHLIFQIEGQEGLSTVLSGTAPLYDAVYRTTNENLDVLPCGPIPPNPSEMLNSKAFSEVLDELSRSYDRILVDSPPIIPVADARILGAMCDMALLVVRAEVSARKVTAQACNGLRAVGTRILGVVVNDVSKNQDYGYYGFEYGYTPNKKNNDSFPSGV
ncbi:MAG TPA: polysaccharide biosynthesis tyrosine autokinase [Planctomycetota bacterium]|nr:polysaccharide biosynthesis tyrosine autokinase [Planctomycetota bacterium]